MMLYTIVFLVAIVLLIIGEKLKLYSRVTSLVRYRLDMIILLFAKKCHKQLEKDKEIHKEIIKSNFTKQYKRSPYSWMWLILPHWRWYLAKYEPKKYAQRYSDATTDRPPKSHRLKLWKINGYKYKFYLLRRLKTNSIINKHIKLALEEKKR